MALKRVALEIGMGTDIRGGDYTKAAVRALRDALWHNSHTDAGAIGKSSDAMQVVVNAAPIADAGPDLVGAPGQELTFAAQGSIDPDGDVAEYLWSFKEGAEASGPRSATPSIDLACTACGSACATTPPRTRRSTTTKPR